MPPTWEGFRKATAEAIASHPTDSNFDDVLAQSFGDDIRLFDLKDRLI
jgi:hypothetical protein